MTLVSQKVSQKIGSRSKNLGCGQDLQFFIAIGIFIRIWNKLGFGQSLKSTLP